MRDGRGRSGWRLGRADQGVDPSAQGVDVEAVDLDALLAGAGAGGEGDSALGEIEGRGEEAAEFGVGFAVHRRGLEFDLEGLAQPADQFAAGGVGDGFDGELGGQGRNAES